MSLICWLPLNQQIGSVSEIINKGSGTGVITPSNVTCAMNNKIGSGMSFNANNSYISIVDKDVNAAINGGSSPFSVSMWIWNEGNGSSTSLRAVYLGDYSLTGYGNYAFNIEKTADGLPRFYWGGNPDWSVPNSTIPANTWSHLVFCYDGTNIYCYLNGVLKGTKTQTLNVKNKSSSGAYYIGRDGRTGDTAFGGEMFDFRIYNHCLSKKEIKDLYKCLIIHYPFNFEDKLEGDGTYSSETLNEFKPDNISGYTLHNIKIDNDGGNTGIGTACAKFNGSSSYVEELVPGWLEEYTFSCWVRFDNTGNYHVIDCRKFNSSNQELAGFQPIYAGLTYQYGIQFYSNNGGSLNVGLSACGWSSADVGKWFHIVGTLSTTGCSVYLNGIKIGTSSGPKTNPTASAWQVSFPLRLGTRGTSANWFNGAIADFKVFASILSDDDVANLYKNRAIIDKIGNLYANSFQENSTATYVVLPTKKSSVIPKSFEEGSSILTITKSDKKIKANNLYEYIV